LDNPQNKDLRPTKYSSKKAKGSLPRKEESTQIRMDPHSPRGKQGRRTAATRREGYVEVATSAKWRLSTMDKEPSGREGRSDLVPGPGG